MHKVTKKIRNIGFVILLSFLSLPWLHSQETFNLNGTFEGEHIEFSKDGSNDSLVYLYKFDLSQDEQKVKGKSYIYNDEGYYAVVQLRGVIVENQLFFEEFSTIDEINPKENPWCYTSGHLDIIKDGEQTTLSGYTKSYTKAYGGLCRLGYSNVSKIDPNYQEDSGNNEDELLISNLSIQPNPTEAEASISFSLSKEEMTIIEVYDLEGELIIEVLRRNLLPGSYSIPIDLSFKENGLYIVELIVNQKLYTTELWKSRF